MRGSNRIARFLKLETVMLGVVAASLVLGAPARAGDDDEDDSGSWMDRMGDSIKHTMDGAGAKVGLNKPEGPAPSEAPSGCPTIAILEGTASSRATIAAAQGNQGVRYQYTLQDVGRQCAISGGRVSIKVAASGRVLLGPAGSAGQFGVPVRVVVFSEAQQKPVSSKLYKVPAAIGGGQSSAPFRFVSDDIVVPTSGRPASEYSIKVGIDAGKGGGDDASAGKGRRHRQKQTASE